PNLKSISSSSCPNPNLSKSAPFSFLPALTPSGSGGASVLPSKGFGCDSDPSGELNWGPKGEILAALNSGGGG
uniref:Uncharacterized protein n=1 Tax=Oryza brachyantha TaxID=4533 RepID=J3MPQ7_ORYBR